MTKEEQELVNNFLFGIIRGESIFLLKQEDGSYRTAIKVEDILVEWRKFKEKVDNA
jgi:hypothetical protein